MLFLDFPARKRFYVLVFRQEVWKQALADSGTQWHACLTIVGNRKLKIILLYYNALGRVPSRAKVGGQGRMRRAERPAIIIILPGRICSAMHKKVHGAKTIAACQMAMRSTWCLVWR